MNVSDLNKAEEIQRIIECLSPAERAWLLEHGDELEVCGMAAPTIPEGLREKFVELGIIKKR